MPIARRPKNWSFGLSRKRSPKRNLSLRPTRPSFNCTLQRQSRPGKAWVSVLYLPVPSRIQPSRVPLRHFAVARYRTCLFIRLIVRQTSHSAWERWLAGKNLPKPSGLQLAALRQLKGTQHPDHPRHNIDEETSSRPRCQAKAGLSRNSWRMLERNCPHRAELEAGRGTSQMNKKTRDLRELLLAWTTLWSLRGEALAQYACLRLSPEGLHRSDRGRPHP